MTDDQKKERTGEKAVSFGLVGIIDFEELQAQKAWLSQFDGTCDAATGLLSFLDFIQDSASAELGPEVVWGEKSDA
jgi:hypothetical protein